MCNFKI